MIRYAKLKHSKRLQRVLRLLSDGAEYSTREIIRLADVCAVNSIMTELRAQGIPIASRCRRGIWLYRLGV